jgi:hypothetical protein
VLQELLLRNQVELVVIIAPASVCPQWQREMATRFGLGFELYNRAFVQRRRQDRGFGVNPWLTHSRFVLSYQTLRHPEYEAPLHAMLSEGERKTLLIDEAIPRRRRRAADTRVPSDTTRTRVIQQLALRSPPVPVRNAAQRALQQLPGRDAGGDGELGPHGARVGRADGQASDRAARASGHGQCRGVQPGWGAGGDGELGQHGARMGVPGHREVSATGRR